MRGAPRRDCDGRACHDERSRFTNQHEECARPSGIVRGLIFFKPHLRNGA